MYFFNSKLFIFLFKCFNLIAIIAEICVAFFFVLLNLILQSLNYQIFFNQYFVKFSELFHRKDFTLDFVWFVRSFCALLEMNFFFWKTTLYFVYCHCILQYFFLLFFGLGVQTFLKIVAQNEIVKVLNLIYTIFKLLLKGGHILKNLLRLSIFIFQNRLCL